MRTILQFCVLAVATLAITATMRADDDMPNFTVKAPSPDTPAVLELTSTLSDTENLAAPTGRYKDLADVATAAILKRDETVSVKTYVQTTEGQKPKLIVVSAAITSPLTLTFASNCAVNSQFTSKQTDLLTRMSQPGNVLAEVCARWTILNHDWTDHQAGIPKSYRVAMFGNRLDITYDNKEVQAYEQTAAVLRQTRLNLVQR